MAARMVTACIPISLGEDALCQSLGEWAAIGLARSDAQRELMSVEHLTSVGSAIGLARSDARRELCFCVLFKHNLSAVDCDSQSSAKVFPSVVFPSKVFDTDYRMRLFVQGGHTTRPM